MLASYAVQQVQWYSSGTAGTAAVQQRYSRYSSGTAYTHRVAVPCTGYSRYSRNIRYSGTARYTRYSRPPGLRFRVYRIMLYLDLKTDYRPLCLSFHSKCEDFIFRPLSSLEINICDCCTFGELPHIYTSMLYIYRSIARFPVGPRPGPGPCRGRCRSALSRMSTWTSGRAGAWPGIQIARC